MGYMDGLEHGLETMQKQERHTIKFKNRNPTF